MPNRKVMKLGSSSLIISLPRDWLENFKIKKGDYLDFDIRSDGALILIPNTLSDLKDKEIEIIASEDFEKGRLERKLIAAYLGNFSKIKIKAENKLTKDQILEIRNKLNKLTGVQIIESSLNEIIIQNLLNINDFEVNKGIYRAYIITLSMFKDTLNSIRNLNSELLDSVIQIDEDVDQFYFLILKQLRTVLSDLRLMNRLNLNPLDCLDYFMIMQRIEHIADHIVKIAEQFKILIQPEVEKLITDTLEDLFKKVGKIFEGSMESFLLGNVDTANNIINQNNQLREKKGKLSTLMEKVNYKAKEIFAYTAIIDSLLRISDYATDIAEVSINRSV